MESDTGRYQLQIQIDAADVVRLVAAGLMIALARDSGIRQLAFFTRSLMRSAARRPQTMIWCAFAPLQKLQVVWDNAKAVYAAPAAATEKVEIESYMEAQPQYKMYAFDGNAIGEAAKEGGDRQTYYLKNDSDADCLMGLAQSYYRQGQAADLAPLNAALLLRGQAAQFLVMDQLRVFLSPQVSSGERISVDTTSQCLLDFSLCSEQRVTLDSNTLCFRAVK